jgi:hypothetical protein
MDVLEITIVLGFKIWEKNNIKRVYFNNSTMFINFLEKAEIKLEYNYDREISKIGKFKLWYDVNENRFNSDKASLKTIFEDNGFLI